MTNRNTKHKPKIIAFTLQKGGVGKTSCVVNLAAALSSMKRSPDSTSDNADIMSKNRILIIDMDVHASATRYLGVYDKKRKSIYDVLTGRCNFDSIIREVRYEFGKCGTCQLDIAPIDVSAATIETNWQRYKDPEHLLSNALKKSKKIREYDYVFIDCPPESNCLLSNIYNTCNYYILTISPDPEAFDNIGITYEQIKTLSDGLKEKKVIGTIINNFEKHDLTYSYWDYLFNNKDAEKYKCFENIIPHCVSYRLTVFKKTPVVFYHRNHHRIDRVYYAYMGLAKEFNERVQSLS